MRTIEIDNELYRFLLNNAEEIGEDASSILRRLLALPRDSAEEEPGDGGAPFNSGGVPPADENPGERSDRNRAFEQFLSSGDLLSADTVTMRFLTILGFLYRQNQDGFEVLREIRGRHRLYFGTSAEQLERSGTSVQPQRIPGTPYWVMTNAPNRQKREILVEAVSRLGYPEALQQQVREVL